MSQLMTYQALEPKNLYRLCSLGGHEREDIEKAFGIILGSRFEKVGLMLDLQNGLPLFPKETALEFAKKAHEAGAREATLAVLAHADEVSFLESRYEHYPHIVEDFIKLEVQVFTSEEEATEWVKEQIS